MCIDFRTVANRLTRLYDDKMASSGLTVTQFSQLNSIQQLGKPTLNELANATGLDRSTLARNVRLLEKLGFVLLRAGDDARTRVIQVTKQGKQAFAQAVPHWQNVQTSMIDSLGEDNFAQLNELLTTTNDACSTVASNAQSTHFSGN